MYNHIRVARCIYLIHVREINKWLAREVPPASYIDLTQLFSTMRRIKSYLRSTMLQPRLN